MDELTEVRTDGNSLLKAVHLSRLRLTRLLLEGGAYINESNEYGETPLMVACKTRHTDSQSVPKHKIVRYLLENGADPNIQDKMGKTALMHACLDQTGVDILSLLLSSGADPTLEDHLGLSALVYAVNSGNREVLRVLLDACKAKGKEVIIITTNTLRSGHQLTRQYLNVPPPPDLEELLHCNPAPCSMLQYEVQLRSPPQGSSASAPPQPVSPFLGLSDPLCFGPGQSLVASQPGSPIKQPSPLLVTCVDKHLNLQRLQSDQWSKSSTVLQQGQTSSLMEEPVEITPKEELSLKISDLALHGRHQAVSRHYSIDVTGLLKTVENLSRNENRGGIGRRSFGRKMSYDSASSTHSASHPDLNQDSAPFTHESIPADEDSSDCLRQLNVSSLQNVVRRRNIGIDHYSSDSQLPQYGRNDNNSRSGGGGGPALGPERHKLVNSKSSTLLGSRDSLENFVQRRSTAASALERRGSGALLLDHIAHTRPGYLPPLNPHAPIPHIGVNPSSAHNWNGSTKAINSVLAGSKPAVPCAPAYQKDLKTKKMLWRRHSMQSEQLNDLVHFKETFGQ